jgi:hypothetical protein
VDRLRGLGNAIVPQVAAEILRADTGEMVAHATTTYALPRS